MPSKRLPTKKRAGTTQKLLERIQDGILILHYPSGVIQNANDSISHFCGLTREQLIGKNFWEIDILANKVQTLELYEQILQKKSFHVHSVALRLNQHHEININLYSEFHTFHEHDSLTLLGFENQTYFDLFEKKISALALHSKDLIGSKFQFLLSAANAINVQNADHQIHVSKLAGVIAKEMGLSTAMIDRIMMCGLVHDIGKISVPAAILNKPSALNFDEVILMKNHVKAGYDILKRLLFPIEIAKVILQHHERLDGSGYPYQLVNSEICLEAKILMVADTLEAMLHTRPYRPKFDLDVSLHQIEVDQYSKLPPEIVHICISLFREKKFSFDGNIH